jgi:hypothetical protein
MRLRIACVTLLTLVITARVSAQVVITPAPVPTCTNGDTLLYDGSDWGCSAAGTGTLTGSGTTGTLPKFSAGTTLADSVITESGGNITIGGALSVTGSITAASTQILGNTVIARAGGLGINDSDVSNVLFFAAGSNLSANRTLTLTTGDASRTLTISGNATLDGTETHGPTSSTDNSCARFDSTSGKIQDSGSACTIADTGVPRIQPTSDGAYDFFWSSSGTNVVARFVSTPSHEFWFMPDVSQGTGNTQGPSMGVGRGVSGGGVAGSLFGKDKNGTTNYIWVDASGNWRTATNPPDEDGTPSDTSGTVIGTQTSMAATKYLDGRDEDRAGALALLRRTPVYRFRYRSGAFPGTEFVGIVTDESPEFGMDVDPDLGIPKSFNPVSAFGYTTLAIQELAQQVDALRARMEGR